MKICLDCGQARPDAAAPKHSGGNRAVLCPDCRRARNQKRHAERVWYKGSWKSSRLAVKRTQRVCQRCGSTDGLEVDHIVARSLSGGLELLCIRCHQRKTNGQIR